MATMPVMVAARRPAHFATGAGFLQEVNERARGRHITRPRTLSGCARADTPRHERKCAEQPAIRTPVRVTGSSDPPVFRTHASWLSGGHRPPGVTIGENTVVGLDRS
jgi:hypothetical protein